MVGGRSLDRAKRSRLGALSAIFDGKLIQLSYGRRLGRFKKVYKNPSQIHLEQSERAGRSLRRFHDELQQINRLNCSLWHQPIPRAGPFGAGGFGGWDGNGCDSWWPLTCGEHPRETMTLLTGWRWVSDRVIGSRLGVGHGPAIQPVAIALDICCRGRLTQGVRWLQSLKIPTILN